MGLIPILMWLFFLLTKNMLCTVLCIIIPGLLNDFNYCFLLSRTQQELTHISQTTAKQLLPTNTRDVEKYGFWGFSMIPQSWIHLRRFFIFSACFYSFLLCFFSIMFIFYFFGFLKQIQAIGPKLSSFHNVFLKQLVSQKM